MAFAELGDAERAWALLTLINPQNHARTADEVARYKVEPYVMAGDVYACHPHVGRGGWTWHTGAAGWMYRLIVESLLGLQREGTVLRIRPRLPAAWPGCTIRYRFGETMFHIVVSRAAGGQMPGLSMDGLGRSDGVIPLEDDRQPHQVAVWL